MGFGELPARFLIKGKDEAEIPEEKSEFIQEEATRVAVFNHPRDFTQAVMVVQDMGKGDMIGVTRKLPHYGKYSYLLFHGERNVAKGIWEAEESPLISAFEN